ncbi:hypothetical protein [Paludisphaera soli]|uniref:hypothetical protein n=1 Tax=Paludisphaera soli TaxID=2712865 RepID=UPI0013ED7E06|nr:hypothetical protein [Paludisphaera soli]
MNVPDSHRSTRRRLTAFLLVSLIAAAAVDGAIFALVQPEYEAHTMIRVSPPPAGLFSTSGPDRGLGLEHVIETEMATLTSDPILDTALSDLDVSNSAVARDSASPREEVRAGLRVENPRNTLFIRVAYASPSPKEAAAVVNAVVGSYMNLQSDYQSGDQRWFISRLDNYAKRLDEEMHQLTERLAEQTSRSSRPGVVSPEDASAISFTSLTEDLARSTAERLVQVDLDLARERDPEKAADLKKTQAGLRALLALPVASRDDVTAHLEKRRIDEISRMQEEVRRKLEDAKFFDDRNFVGSTLVHQAQTPAAPSRNLRGPLMAAATGSILLIGLAIGLQPGRARAPEAPDGLADEA